MGAKSGSITYRRFTIKDFGPESIPDNFREAYATRVMLNAFKPIDPEGEEQRSFGWVNIDQILDFDFANHHEKFIFNEFIALAFRVDTLKVPGPLFKAFFAQAKADKIAEKEGQAKLTKGEEEVLKLQVQRHLRQQMMPSIRTVDMVFSTHTGVVRFWSTSPKVCDEFWGLFEETFQLELIPEVPYILAARACGEDQEMFRRLQEATPTPLFL